MNKKKLVASIVSLVMAGTMAASFTACGPTDGPGPNGPGDITDNKPIIPSAPIAKPVPAVEVKKNEYATNTTVRVSIGYSTTDTTAISFSTTSLPLIQHDNSQAGTEVTLPDGKTYQKGSLKPIWQDYEQALGIKISDDWTMSSNNLPECVQKGLEKYDLIGAGSLDQIQTQITASALLNLNDYKEYLPNLWNFLNNNALAKLGVVSNGETGAFYYAPYYAGMNDAERYNMFRRDYVSELLDHANLSDVSKNGGTVTFKAQADAKKSKSLGNRGANETYDGTKGSIASYMGKTGSYVVETTNPADTLKTIYVKVNYDAALAAAKDANSKLGKAIADAAGKTYDGESGNIVDLQNFVIDAKSGEIKGEHLLNILREYIDVTYQWADTADASNWAQFYNSTVKGVKTTRGDIINASYAAWDVDIYAAIGRCFVTCGNLLGKYQSQASAYTNNGASTWLFTPRTGYTNRTTRLTAMIGELYGIRGMEGMSYLDSSGNRREARFNVGTWDALTKFSAFHTEGLVPSFNTKDVNSELGSVGSNSSCSVYDEVATHFQGLSTNDFIHTQTTISNNKYASSEYVETEDGYDWTGVMFPVSKWLTTDTSKVDIVKHVTADVDTRLDERPANRCTIMRFTESALKLKTGGLVIPKSTADNPDRLHATLALVDYLYSNDGLIVTTFGDISTKDNISGNATAGYTTDNDGWWYGKPVTTLNINGTATDVSTKTMEELKALGVVTTIDNNQYTMTPEYQSQALVYKNKLYKTGVEDTTSQYDVNKSGYVYNGVMTPYLTRAARALCLDGVSVNGYKAANVTIKKNDDGTETRTTTAAVWSSTNLQNLALGQEGFGINNNAAMVQLCNDDAVKGFDIISTGLGNGSLKTVEQAIGKNTWYTCSPSVTLPSSAATETGKYTAFSKLFETGSKITNYFILEVGWYGENLSFADFTEVSPPTNVPKTPEAIVTYLRGIAPQQEDLYNSAWSAVFGAFYYYEDTAE